MVDRNIYRVNSLSTQEPEMLVSNLIADREILYTAAKNTGENFYIDEDVFINPANALNEGTYHYTAEVDTDVSVFEDSDGGFWLLNDSGHVSL